MVSTVNGDSAIEPFMNGFKIGRFVSSCRIDTFTADKVAGVAELADAQDLKSWVA
jgi:hypothetical protein